jgi:hypothetical protein
MIQNGGTARETMTGLVAVLALTACVATSPRPGASGASSTTPAADPGDAPPTSAEQMRISGDKSIVPDDPTKTEIQKAGVHKIVTTYKLCIGKDGVPSDVTPLQASGFPAYDAKIQREMRQWRYRPYSVDGVPKPVCTSVTFIYQQDADAHGPIELAFTSPRTTIVLLTAGDGLRTPLRMQPSRIGKQRIQMTVDWKSVATMAGGEQHRLADPTLVLAGASTAIAVRPDGGFSYRTIIDRSEARTDSEKIDSGFLVGLQIDGLVSSTGVHGKTTFTVQDAPWQDEDILKNLHHNLVTWPLLPEDPITAGAQWEVTTTETVAKIELTSVTRYTLVARTPTTATLVGLIKLAGADQTLKSQELRAITGTGRIEVTLEQGRIYPKLERTLHLDFTAKRAQSELAPAPVSLDSRVTLEPK